MYNYGYDFGSTYSMVSVYRNGRPEGICLTESEASPMVPTVLGLDKRRRLRYGRDARSQAGKAGCLTWRGFKMLLTKPEDSRMVYERGYIPAREGEEDEENLLENRSPRAIAKAFMEYHLKKCLGRIGESEIGKLVVGAPAIWFQAMDTMEGRNILLDICQKLSISIGDIRVVSEPESACAYFAYNYKETMKEPFEGTILLVDYGGGTLDNTLAQVRRMTNEKGEEFMEIRTLGRNGMGENEEGKVGQAGMLYMEAVVRKAIEASGLFEGEILADDAFSRAVNELESQLQTRTEEVNNVIFYEIGIWNEDDLDEEEFTTISYKKEDISVTYGMLTRAYNEEIRDSFAACLSEMDAIIEEKEIDTKASNFKIAPVGGFCNYSLVWNQIVEKYGLVENDPRLSGIITSRADCEKAIAYGASLIAEGVISIKATAPYSIAISQKLNGAPVNYYTFHVNDEIEYNKPYYPIRDGRFVPTYVNQRAPVELVFNYSRDERKATRNRLRPDLQKEIKRRMSSLDNTYCIGFSLDPSEVLYLHVSHIDIETGQLVGQAEKIPLADYRNLFDTSVPQSVYNTRSN